MTFPVDANAIRQDGNQAEIGAELLEEHLNRASSAQGSGAAASIRKATQVAKHRSSAGARTVFAQARRRPISTGLLLASTVAGGAVLLNPALRRLAIANAPLLIRTVRNRVNRAQS